MTTMPLLAVDHSAPQLSGATTEVLTVSGLLSMPAVWTAVVDRELPLQVLLERFLIVLLTCALLAELVRRLGEGGALGHAFAAGHGSTRDADPATAADVVAPAAAPSPLFDDAGDDLALGGFESDATIALDAPLDLGDPGGAGDAGDFDLAPLDLDADPF